MAIPVGPWRPQATENTSKSLIRGGQTLNLSRRRSRVRAPSSPPEFSLIYRTSFRRFWPRFRGCYSFLRKELIF